jgi:hypothetical protein
MQLFADAASVAAVLQRPHLRADDANANAVRRHADL